MRIQNVRVVILTAVAAAVLSACSSFSIKEPQKDAIIKAPSNTKVIVIARPSMSALSVQVDNLNRVQDVTNQFRPVSAKESTGDISLPAGNYTITAQAEVPCWYCSRGNQTTWSQTSFCVASESWPSTVTTFSAFSMNDNLSWAKTSDASIGIDVDNGKPTTRWYLIRVGGILSPSVGLIKSTENTCLCMRSTSTLSETPIGLAICDAQDKAQLWQAWEEAGTNPKYYRFQNYAYISGPCLSEGSNGVLVQRDCRNTNNKKDQLWRIRDNKLNLFVSPF